MTQSLQVVRKPIPYDPHPGQILFHTDREKYRWRALIGGTGSGKTQAGCLEFIYWALTYPKSIGAVYEPTFPMLNKILIPKLDLFLGYPFQENPLVKSFNKAEGLIVWYNLSQTWLNSLQEPERAEGQNLDYAWIDEARLVRYLELALKVISRRLRGSGSNSPIGAWITTTPDGPLSDLWNFLENPKTRNDKSRIYRMSIFDNPYLPKEYVDEVVKSHSGGLAERFVWGRFADVGVGTYPFDYSLHVIDPPRAIFSPVYGVDLGWTNPSVILCRKIDNDGRAYIVGETYKTQMTQEDLVTEAKEMIARFGNGPFICDRSEPQTIEYLRRAGIQAKGQESTVKVEDGIKEIGSRLTKAGDNRPRLFFSPECVNTIEEIQLYDASLPKGKQRDHAMDALRYCLSEGSKLEPAFVLG